MTSSPPGSRPRRFARLPHRYQSIAMPLVLSIMMTFVVSGISTLKVLGLGSGFLASWAAAWGLSWLVAFPTLIVVLPLVRRLVGLIVEPPPR